MLQGCILAVLLVLLLVRGQVVALLLVVRLLLLVWLPVLGAGRVHWLLLLQLLSLQRNLLLLRMQLSLQLSILGRMPMQQLPALLQPMPMPMPLLPSWLRVGEVVGRGSIGGPWRPTAALLRRIHWPTQRRVVSRAWLLGVVAPHPAAAAAAAVHHASPGCCCTGDHRGGGGGGRALPATHAAAAAADDAAATAVSKVGPAAAMVAAAAVLRLRGGGDHAGPQLKGAQPTVSSVSPVPVALKLRLQGAAAAGVEGLAAVLLMLGVVVLLLLLLQKGLLVLVLLVLLVERAGGRCALLKVHWRWRQWHLLQALEATATAEAGGKQSTAQASCCCCCCRGRCCLPWEVVRAPHLRQGGVRRQPGCQGRQRRQPPARLCHVLGQLLQGGGQGGQGEGS